MPPRASANGVLNCGCRNAKCASEPTVALAAFIALPQLQDERLSEPCARIRFPVKRAHAPTPLGVHVANIVRLCAKKQMVRANARRVVAAVEDEQASRHRAIVNLPGRAMRAMHSDAPVSSPKQAVAAVYR